MTYTWMGWIVCLGLVGPLAGCPGNDDDDSAAADPEWYEISSGVEATLRGVWAPGDGSVFAVGDEGTIVQFDGDTWTATTAEPYPDMASIQVDLEGVWGASATDVYAVGIAPNDVTTEGEIWHRDTAWAMERAIDGGLEAIHGLANACAFAVGSWYDPDPEGDGSRGYLVLRDPFGDGVFIRDVEEDNSSELRGVWATSCTDAFAVGGDADSRILHYDGASWTVAELTTGNDLWDVWAASSTDAFAVGNAGSILRFDGTEWTPMDSGVTANLRGVWGTSATNVFAVGEAGSVLQFDGTDWTPLAALTSEDLKAVRGTSDDDVYVVGAGGTILRHGVAR